MCAIRFCFRFWLAVMCFSLLLRQCRLAFLPSTRETLFRMCEHYWHILPTDTSHSHVSNMKLTFAVFVYMMKSYAHNFTQFNGTIFMGFWQLIVEVNNSHKWFLSANSCTSVCVHLFTIRRPIVNLKQKLLCTQPDNSVDFCCDGVSIDVKNSIQFCFRFQFTSNFV